VQLLARRMEMIIFGWLIVFMAAAAVRIELALSPIGDLWHFAEVFLPYALAALAPIAGYRLAMAAFPVHILPARPGFQLPLSSRWRRLSPIEARRHPAFGPFGFMACLLFGMLLNVAVRSFEFLLAVPAMNTLAPAWGSTIFYVLAFDLVAMNFLYGVCFVMAVRSIPLFPRMLMFAWFMDAFMQLAMARAVGATVGLPDDVAAGMQDLLTGNVTKVLISAAVWIPYLLLSDRVNVTYRSRAPANSARTLAGV
jgi:hypothetical protein